MTGSSPGDWLASSDAGILPALPKPASLVGADDHRLEEHPPAPWPRQTSEGGHGRPVDDARLTSDLTPARAVRAERADGVPCVCTSNVIGVASTAHPTDGSLLARGADVQARPAVAIDFGRIGNLDVRAASVRGLAHRHGGTTRQDQFGFALSDDRRWLVVGCADGVSAASLAHRAAIVAAHEGTRHLASQLSESSPKELDWDGTLRHVAARITRVATEHLGDAAPNDFAALQASILDTCATTAHYAVIATEPGERNEHEAWCVGVGDTSAWILSRSTWIPLTDVKNAGSTIASSAVVPLPLLPAPVTRIRTSLAAGEALIVMSDGVGDAIGAGHGEAADQLATWWQTPPDPYSFAAAVDFNCRTYDDDRTAVAIWART